MFDRGLLYKFTKTWVQMLAAQIPRITNNFYHNAPQRLRVISSRRFDEITVERCKNNTNRCLRLMYDVVGSRRLSHDDAFCWEAFENTPGRQRCRRKTAPVPKPDVGR